MATRTTNFPVDRRSLAFRAVEAILREDPAIVACGTRFRTWDGDQMDGTEITTGQMPMIRLCPMIRPNINPTMGFYTAQFVVRVEGFVKGLIVEDILGLWSSVENALVMLKPFRDTTVQCYLNEQCGNTVLKIQDVGFGSWESPKEPPATNLYGAGKVVIDLLIPR